jgi:hypothetical protein
MDHIRIPFSDDVEWWYLARLQAEAMADPALADRADRGTRLVAESVARARKKAGYPPVGRYDPHQGHEIGKDAAGVEVCWTCTAADAAEENP